jgi:hypothetical protein
MAQHWAAPVRMRRQPDTFSPLAGVETGSGPGGPARGDHPER